MLIRIIRWSLRCLAVSALVVATPLDAQSLTPQAAIGKALTGNPSLQATFASLDEAAGHERRAKAAGVPHVTLHEIAASSDNGLLGIAFSALQRDPSGFRTLGAWNQDFLTQLAVTLPVMTGGEIGARRRQAGLGRQLARAQQLIAINSVLFQVLEAFDSVCLAREAAKVREATVSQAREHVALGEARFRQEMLLESEVLNLRVSLAAAQQDAVSAQHDLELSQAHLAILLGDPPDTHYTIDSPIGEASGPFLNLPAGSQRPELAAKDLETRIAREDHRIANRMGEPKVSVFGAAEFDASHPQFENQSTTVGLLASIDVFDGGDRRGRREETEARVRRIERETKALADAIKFEEREAALKLDEAHGRLALATQALAPAQENLRLTIRRFQEGMATSFNVIDARHSLTLAQMSRLEAEHGVTMATLASIEARGNFTELARGFVPLTRHEAPPQ